MVDDAVRLRAIGRQEYYPTENEDEMANYEISTGTFKEDLIDFNVIKFINSRRDQNLSVDYFDIDAKTSRKTISDVIAEVKKKTNIDLSYTVHTKHNAEFYGNDIIIALNPDYDLKTLKIQAYGSPDCITRYGAIFKKAFPSRTNDIKMSWYYSSRGGYDSTDLPLDGVAEIKDSYYPFIEGGVEDYLERYHTSKNSILLLVGEPGTGKTSFIRNYLNSYSLNSIVTYDEQVMQRDDFYINFLTSSKKHVLVVEDADVLLLARADGDNKIMSKFLNVSDGLVKGLNKKIIFSTNITELNRIDSAITRPGRCFDVLTFRGLTLEEANKICDDENLPHFEDRREYSLADVFNRAPRHTKPRKVGFT